MEPSGLGQATTRADIVNQGIDLHGTEGPGPAPTSKLEEAEIFKHVLHPSDSYDEDGVYWADMPFAKKVKFVTSVDGAETRKELSQIGAMMKVDPLSPISFYFKNYVIPGAGLGLEGYVLFSIGNLTPLYQKVWPTCWKAFTSCEKEWTRSVTYLEVLGIIVGQLLVGVLGDWIGRRWGLIQDATIMFLGLIMLTASWGTTLNGWVICYAWSLFIYGIGVGGEYPMTATSGMENAVGSGKVSTREDRLHRGRKVTSAFLMQGWGQLWNQVILIVALLVFHHGSGNPPYSEISAQWTYRISFAIPAVGTLWLIYYRAYKMPAASKQLQAAKKATKVTGYDTKALKITFTYFGPRILATAGAWFCNDVFFYGNKLFQGNFIAVISPNNKSVMEGWLYNLINVAVSLVGYYMASFLIDNKLYGRKKMQIVGFMLDFILFAIPAFHYHFYTEKAHIRSFQTMYFLSSFFNQFGPNAVTFLVAAEVFPTPIRATAHGFSAAFGKLGALTAAVIYDRYSTQKIFYIVPWFGLLGALVTFLFLPDTTSLDLKEQERRWYFIREGREQDYHGVAIHPKHLSLWERWRGVGKHYDPQLDYQQRIDEMRAEWEAAQAAKTAEEDKDGLPHEAFDTGYSHEINDYFEKTGQKPAKNGTWRGEKDITPDSD
jgi:MFS family permease